MRLLLDHEGRFISSAVLFNAKAGVEALHASGQHDTVTVLGNWGRGDHSVTVSFLNDA